MDLLLGATLVAAALVLVSTWRRHPALGIVCLPGFAAVASAVAVSLWGASMIEVAATGPATRVWTAENITVGVEIFCFLGIALMAGPWLIAVSSRRPLPSDRTLGSAIRLESKRRSSFAAVASLSLTGAFVLIYGSQNLWDRSVYIPHFAIQQLASFVAPLLPASFVMATLAHFSDSRFNRIIGVFAASFSIMVAFGTASRMLAVFPILWLAVAFVSGRRLRVRGVIGAIFLVAGASSVALRMRNLPAHGVVPYFLSVVETPPQLSLDGVFDSVLNVLFAVPLAGAVVRTHSFGFPELLISINPSFGDEAGWTELSPRLRIHQYIPFNGIGELASVSYALAMLICLLLSMAVAVLVRRAIALEQSTWVAVSLALYFLFFILLLQYNFRSSMRIAYLLGVMLVVGRLIAERIHHLRAVRGPNTDEGLRPRPGANITQ